MTRINISKYCEMFRVKKVKIMNDLKGKKTIMYLPNDFICYVDDEKGAVSFKKFVAEFDFVAEQDVFSVCVDDFFWIGKDFKLTDDENSKILFGRVAKGKKGKKGDIDYSSIHARVAAVYTALCEGKIKIGKTNKVED